MDHNMTMNSESLAPFVINLPYGQYSREAFEKAFEQDDQVLVEEEITGREFTIGVFRKGDEIIALPMTEVKSLNYFFDFEAKYAFYIGNSLIKFQDRKALVAPYHFG